MRSLDELPLNSTAWDQRPWLRSVQLQTREMETTTFTTYPIIWCVVDLLGATANGCGFQQPHPDKIGQTPECPERG